MRGYTRWTVRGDVLRAGWIGARFAVVGDKATGTAGVVGELDDLTPDECRMLGVRLIEVAALVDVEAVREVRPA